MRGKCFILGSGLCAFEVEIKNEIPSHVKHTAARGDCVQLESCRGGEFLHSYLPRTPLPENTPG